MHKVLVPYAYYESGKSSIFGTKNLYKNLKISGRHYHHRIAKGLKLLMNCTPEKNFPPTIFGEFLTEPLSEGSYRRPLYYLK